MPKTPLSFYLHMIAVAVIVFAVGRYLPLPLAGEAETMATHRFRGEGLTPTQPSPQGGGQLRESAYDRVIRTGVIRCGYGVFPPYITKDANTGQLGGSTVQLFEQMAKLMDIKVNWAEEVDWGQIATALDSDKIDVMCAPIWATAQRGKFIGFTDPIFYSTVEAVVRQNDARFDANLSAVNDAAIRIAINEGDLTEEVAKADYPLAQKIGKVQIAGEALLLQDVAANKADITFTNRSILQEFQKNNPNQLRLVANVPPIRVFANVFGVRIGEDKLIGMLNAALRPAELSGFADKILKPQADQGLIRMINIPYQN